jgi:hypothetical protein
MRKLSEHYFRCLEESKRHHRTNRSFGGELVFPHAVAIRDLIRRLGCASVLDYGCGKGRQYEIVDETIGVPLEEFWGVPVMKYDPAWPAFETKPVGKFDLVLCTHVLGSIPVADLPVITKRLFGYADKAIYVAEIIGPVRKKVFSRPDLMPIGWSREQWMAALARKSPIEVTLAFRSNTPDGDAPSWWRSCGSEFLAVGGMVAT